MENVLKKGEWAKEKGIEVIKSKKNNADEDRVQKVNKKRKGAKKDESEETQASDKFTHIVFVQNIFDSVKVVPPTSAEELEKTIADLQTKLDYFLEHPEGEISRPNIRNEKQKSKYTAEKYVKGRNTSKNVINTEDFPFLE